MLCLIALRRFKKKEAKKATGKAKAKAKKK